MWIHLLVPFFFSSTNSAMPGPRCRKINKADLHALPRCNLGGKALKRIFQCHLVVGLGAGKTMSNMKELEITSWNFQTPHLLRRAPPISVSFNKSDFLGEWTNGSIQSFLTETDSIRKIPFWLGPIGGDGSAGISTDCSAVIHQSKPCYLKYDLRTASNDIT